MDNSPEELTSEDIRLMSEDDFLNMDYFLNEDDLFSDEAGVKALISSKYSVALFLRLPLCRLFSFLCFIKFEFSYKVKNGCSINKLQPFFY